MGFSLEDRWQLTNDVSKMADVLVYDCVNYKQNLLPPNFVHTTEILFLYNIELYLK